MKVQAQSSLEDFVLVFDDALPSSLSARLVNEYQDCGEWITATVDDEHEKPNVRNCDVIEASDPLLLATSQVRTNLAAEVTDLTASWARRYEDETTPIGLTGRTGLALVRYRQGGFYRAHQDNHESEIRTVTIIAVLHTEFTGGELSFFGGDLIVPLRPGQVCMFPATFQYPHSVEAVRSGVRYSMVTWLN